MHDREFITHQVVGAAIAAGLTMGLLSLDAQQLKLTMEIQAKDCTNPEEEAELMKERALATKLYPLVRRHHWLLVTLLLLNTLANEALPLFLDEIVPTPLIAILISVSFVLLFGEIIPSAIFTVGCLACLGAFLICNAKQTTTIRGGDKIGPRIRWDLH